MLRYLTGEDNTKRAVNENYGRELMELFTLGVTDAAGNPNYTETDVREAARSASGWQIEDDDPDAVQRRTSPGTRWDDGTKTVLGRTGAFDHRQLVDVVLAPPEPRAVPGPEAVARVHPHRARRGDACATWCACTRARGFRLKPLVRRILTHPAMLASVREPNMIKPPVVLRGGDDEGARPRHHRRLALQRAPRHGPDPVLPADGGGVGGRHRMAQHQHRARALRDGEPVA